MGLLWSRNAACCFLLWSELGRARASETSLPAFSHVQQANGLASGKDRLHLSFANTRNRKRTGIRNGAIIVDFKEMFLLQYDDCTSCTLQL